ncbi:GNAT family N-acetyltransferase [Jiangella mangrovi]|uniref:Ribosomal protein S18 acetylase RimI-like enzyme n=1 Tax=Jiangella mangrovi TaxID=1524084 RepID=A0A7W9GPG2_9ACTN|nr:GNAT family N-acetyltransferase [Jiangella mangrovi]MBB5787637.1 ribosomal protein S18 acetylase RimI-like enzyme [Jiangella mangrovi]
MSAGGEIEVGPATEDDLRRTAALHVAELPHGLFPRLGEGFVRRWHRAHLESEYGVVLVARRGGDVVGFLLGTTDRPANVAWILGRRRRELMTAGLRALLTRPALALGFVRTRGPRYARRLLGRAAVPARVASRGDVPEAGFGPIAVLEAIVVAPEARGASAGTALSEEFLSIVAAAGGDRVELITKAGARGAAGFYERAGWRRVGSHVDRDGDEVHTYRIDPRFVRTR